MTSILIYGGTFDPPHKGHLETALEIQRHFHFDRFLFVPCREPVLKKTCIASPEHRLQMLRLLLENHQELTIDTREMLRHSPSYMVDTLLSFRKEVGEHVIMTLCIGMDAYLQLPLWHDYKKILTLCHLLVLHRQNIQEPSRHVLASHKTNYPKALFTTPFGKIYLFNAGDYPISSSQIRNDMKAGRSVEAYLPAKVLHFIQEQKLYQ